MKRSVERGFTLVEIMIVVAIIALLAAIAIPNVLRGRATANETASIGNVRALISSLEMYRSVYQAYPQNAASWQTSLYTNINPPFGPPSFDIVMTGAGPAVQGFQYRYSEGPANPVQSYTMKATPTGSSSGTRVFFGTDTGQVFHCAGPSTSINLLTSPPQAQIVTIDSVPQTCPP